MRKLLLALLLTTTALLSHAYTTTINGVTYYYTGSGSTAYAQVNDCSTSLTDVTIPESITISGTTYPVTGINSYAFDACSALTQISIPGSVTSIGNYAFRNCSSLAQISIPESVTSIGTYAFDGCSSLQQITIPEGVPLIGSYTFRGCTALTQISIPESVTYIDTYAFDGCSSLKQIILPEGVTSIGSYAFRGCTALTQIAIPESVTSFGTYTFSGCTSLKQITIPKGISSIGTNTFSGCSSLAKISIPTNITSISNYAFNGCTALDSLIIEDSNKSLKLGYNDSYRGLFYNCPLSSVYLGRNITYDADSSYGYSPFANCKNLKNVIISSNVTGLNDYMFYGCSGLSQISIPASVTSINNYAFNGCTALDSLVIEDSETTLSLGYNYYYSSSTGGKGLFYDCPLSSVYIGRKLSYSTGLSYGYSPFANNGGIKSITINSNDTPIQSHTFRGCSGLMQISMLEGVTSIGSCAFSDCNALTQISIPKGVTSIDNDAFSGCSALAQISIPAGVTSIGSEAFSGCNALTQISIPESVTSIKNNTFYGCSGLTQISIPEGVTSIGGEAFSGCSSLAQISIPASVTSIGNYAFNGCTALDSLVIEDSETTLSLGYNGSNMGLFYDCPLSSVYLGRNISYSTSYGYSPFANRTKLENVTIGSNVTTLGFYAFRSCSALTKITIPANVTSISENAFGKMAEVEMMGGAPEVSEASFAGIGTLRLLEPTSFPSYAAHNVWQKFDHIVAQVDSVDYALIRSDLPLTVSVAIDAGENCYAVPMGDECTLTTDAKVQVYLRSENISEQLAEGYTFTPDVAWRNNIVSGMLLEGEKVRAVTLTEAGTLFDELGVAEIQAIEYLTIAGPINGTDIMTINRMPLLKGLNLSQADIREGGQTYRDELKTANNVVGTDIFYNVPLLRYLTLPESATTIASDAFRGKTTLEHVTIGSTTTAINSSAFYGCTGLTEIEIPSSVTNIGEDAFSGCTNLAIVKLQNGSNTLTFYNDNNAFASCPITYLHLGRNVTLSYNSYSPFRDKTTLKEVTTGPDVTTLKDNLFYGCSGLESVELPENVSSIGSYTFRGCSSLKELILPEAVTTINSYLCYGCSSLERLSIGSKVTSIPYNAFSDCSALKNIISMNMTPPQISSDVFAAVDKENCLLELQKGAMVYYWLDPEWQKFLNMSESIYSLSPLPQAVYGGEPIDLSAYAPKGSNFVYESSNSDVALIEGTTLTIVGAGEATVAAYPADSEEVPTAIIGQMRQFFVDKAALTIKAPEMSINLGEELPEIALTYSGFVYSDTEADLDSLPQVEIEGYDGETPGIYTLRVRATQDRNYNITTEDGTLTVENVLAIDRVEVANVVITTGPGTIRVSGLQEGLTVVLYTTAGAEAARARAIDGTATFSHLTPGVYIVRYATQAHRAAVF